MRSTNPREVVLIFREHARSIHAKASPADPNFLRVAVACAKIEQWAEHNYPSFVRAVTSDNDASPSVSFDPTDARSRISYADGHGQTAVDEKRALEMCERIATAASSASQGPPWDVLTLVGGGVLIVLAFLFAVLHFTA